MARPSFAALKCDLDEACATLRGFTLGRPGITQRDGEAWIRKVRDLCDKLATLFKSGRDAAKATTAIAAGRAKAGAAQARLNLLEARRQAGRQAG